MSKQPKTLSQSKTFWAGIMFLVGAVLNEVGAYFDQLPTDHTVTGTAVAGAVALIVLRVVSKSEIVFPKK